MSDRYIEKTFLYLVAVSLLLHAAVFAFFVMFPAGKKPVARQEPIMIDLENLPNLQQLPQPRQEPARRQAERSERTLREIAPRGEREREKAAAVPRPPLPPRQSFPQPVSPGRGEQAPAPDMRRGEIPARPLPPGGGLLKPRQEQTPAVSQLYPSAERMARLEEGYRKKYGPEVEEGDTKFLDTDDIQFGSFLRRFETAIYGIWQYPADAARLGVEGVTAVKITFNRRGEIERWDILQSSGSRILDNEVERTLRSIGRVGPFPKGYDKERFNLIAFFQYGIMRGASRSLH